MLNAFERTLSTQRMDPLVRPLPQTLQINLGKHCNQACRHCHVDAGPTRTEAMSSPTIDRLLHVLGNSPSIGTVDITGGAPELHPEFRRIVAAAHGMGKRTIDRCNLTVLSVPGQEGTAAFLAEHRTEVVASLPCYGPENVNKQRGGGVFDQSIHGLRMLNELGYGHPDSDLCLNLVYNPIGAFLPPDQADLEEDYKRQLADAHGIVFNRLYTITNMPIARFKSDLARAGKLQSYMALLTEHFNPAAVANLMCRDLVSVSHEGKLYDCDFNQMLDIPAASAAQDLWDLNSFETMNGSAITTGSHCLGCTAGAGSSCGGALQ
jgi:radical SAM/Cys-rich protein